MRRRAEFLLPILMISIMVFGLIVLFSATFGEREEYLFGRQLVWVLLSCAVFVFTAYVIKRNFWKSMSIVLIFASVVTLVAVLYLGSGEGSRRWIDLGIASFQPSELAKFSLILFLGFIYSREAKNKYGLFSLGVLSAAIFAGLIYLEPDLGSTIIIVVIWYFVTLISKRFDKLMIAMTALIAFVVPVVFMFGLKPYQRDRLLSFLNPEEYASGAAYNTIQAIRAIGSGGLKGTGMLQGTMNRLGYVPADHTDFIFSVLGEEWGFIGSVSLIVLYSLLLWRIWSITRKTTSEFGRIVLSGIFAVFAFHVVENIGMNLGLLPVTGIPLPFVSYGGSSSMIFALQLGIVQSYTGKEVEYDREHE
ncbi:cell cycle protein [Mesotoga sp. SC_3PWM13N19]|uniref:FtsW/RodA/SpoVE family cell cycle protein n=1 Tax=Mesotoga sp. TaxID=2053577 RepID=UPI000B02692B|nr:FtsW/RodA/SpoVE family cell cycle protein [Mesotoga sp.]MDD3459739.1 FtsW/RodA/SpoVE family cell cycle protein [Mesotoga sp.]PXF35537.1 cell cycle protein [Mesotoga sp. SC_NapDC]RAM63899.1 cell cycle protein [Mesotoga sp. SC_3PWM13N19]